MKKKYWSKNVRGSLCSGYGVFPDGKKCKGCSDCGGKKITTKQAIEQFNKNHTTLKLKSKKK